MAPRSASRTYGSTEDFSNARSLSSISDDGPRSRESASHDPVTQSSPALTPGRRGRWAKVALVCGLAAGAVSAIVRSSSKNKGAALGEDEANNRESFVNVGAGTARPPSSATRVGTHTSQGGSSEDGSSHDAPRLSFTALNLYHVRDGKPGQDYPWLKDVKLIEPHRETTLSVTNSREGFSYRWEIRGGTSAGAVHASASGADAIVYLTRLDENVIVLEEVDRDGVVTRRLDETVMVKYVRREIRSLTDDEREELFDAMLKLWAVRVQNGNGREIYGDQYSDIWAINRLHYKAASPQVCDHFHDGLGFLTNHAVLSNTFEYSLQQVNPKLTLPYWDFTIESSSAGATANVEMEDVFQSQTKTPLLQASWFGTRDPVDNMVKDGRWAYTEIPRMVQNNPSGIEPDVYSKLRAPWNINDRAYLTRGLGKMCHVHVEEAYPWPTCAMHHELATSYDDFYSWVWGSLYDPHGPVHVWIGGVLDCEETYAKVADLVGDEIARELALISFVHRKNMFRDGIFKCEGSVEVSEQAEEVLSTGVCGCLDYDLTQGDDYVKIFKTMAFMEEYVADVDTDTQRKLVQLLCSSTVNDGDHLQASSSLDPSFWPTHPTMERLWMFSVLTGKVTDFHWPDSDVSYTASDGTTYSESISIYSDECVGHRGSDVFPFGLLDRDTNDFTVQTGIKGNVPGGGNNLTNKEVLAAFDPNINALPYVYDTFKWKHCEADGVFMDDAWLTSDDNAVEGAEIAGASAENHRVKSSAMGPKDRASVGGKTVFESDAPRYPMYGSLRAKMRDLRERKSAA